MVAMSYRRVGERRERGPDGAGSSVGRSPWTFTTMPARPSGSMCWSASKMRFGARRMVGGRHHGRPAGLLGRHADRLRNRSPPPPRRPPAARGARQHMGDHRLAADIGERLAGPAGSRPSRAGMRMMTSSPAMDRDACVAPRHPGMTSGRPLIRVARREATGYLCAACEGPGPFRLPDDDLRSCSAMDSDQVNKVLMAVLFTCLGILSLNIAAGAHLHPAAAGQAGLR